jgi:hypothetical protein
MKAFMFGILLLFGFGIFSQPGMAQSDTTNRYAFIGLDLGKSFYANTAMKAPGWVVEAHGRYGQRDGLGFYLGAGICDVRHYREVKQIDYRCKGQYLKLGVEKSYSLSKSNHSVYLLGLMANLAQVNQSGFHLIEGNYFPTYRHPFSRQTFQTGLQLSNQFILPVAKHWHIGIQAAAGMVLNHHRKYKLNNYYAPGLGVTGESRVAFSTAISIQYSIR